MDTSKGAICTLRRAGVLCARRSATAYLLIGMMALLPAGVQAKAAKTKSHRGSSAKAESTTTTTPAKQAATRTRSQSREGGTSQVQLGGASWYTGYRYTASGRFDPNSMTAAHRTLPFGTIVRATARDGRYVDVRIDNRGPFVRGRILDLTPAAFKHLAPLNRGVVAIRMEVLSKPQRRPRS